MKKILSIFLCMTLCFLTACANSEPSTVLPNPSPESSAAPTATITEEPAIEKKVAPQLELSGSKEDIYVIDEDCYVEGANAILYLQKGLSVPGDLLVTIEGIMNDLCEYSGLTFDKKYFHEKNAEYRDHYYEPGIFADVNKDFAKVNILIVDLEDGYIEYADYDNTVLDIADFDFSFDSCQTAYHELAHVLQSRNGVFMSGILDEGYASYMTDKVLRAKNLSIWNSLPLYFPVDFDENRIFQGEEGFNSNTDDRHDNYKYGLRFLHFLTEQYGDDIYNKLLAKATAEGYDNSYETNNEAESKEQDRLQIISIIKSVTSADVFEQFGKWYTENWERVTNAYLTDMENITGGPVF